MADSARSRFFDRVVDHPFRLLAPAGMRDYLAFFRLGHLETWIPPAADFADLAQGVPGALIEIVGLYCQLDAPDDEVYFLEYKVTINRANGAKSSIQWLSEEAAQIRWRRYWCGLRERAMERRTFDFSFGFEEAVETGVLDVHIVNEKLWVARRAWENEPVYNDPGEGSNRRSIRDLICPIPEVCECEREGQRSEIQQV